MTDKTIGAEQAQEFALIKKDVGDIKTLLSKIVEVVSRFNVLEERQQSTMDLMVKMTDRLEKMEERQHKVDVANARHHDYGQRIVNLETSVKELHIEGERTKARFQTSVWIARALWTALGGVLATWAFTWITGGGASGIVGH